MKIKTSLPLTLTVVFLIGVSTAVSHAQNVGIGTTHPDTTLHIIGNIKIDDSSQAEGHLLVSDSAGVGSWGKLSGSSIFDLAQISPDPCMRFVDTLPGLVSESVVAAYGYAYLTDNLTDEIKVINISNATKLEVVNSIAITNPVAVSVHDQLLAVVTVDSFVLYQLTTPEMPAHVSSFFIGGEPVKVQLSNEVAHILDDAADRVLFIDISNPSAPSVAGDFVLSGSPKDIAVSDTVAFVSTTNDMVSVISFAQPASPHLLTEIVIDFVSEIAVNAGYLYATTAPFSTTSLVVYNISDPSSPVLQDTEFLYFLPTQVDIELLDDYAVVRTSAGLRLFDIRNPNDIQPMDNLSSSGLTDIAVFGNTAICCRPSGSELVAALLFCPISLVVDPINGLLTDGISPMWGVNSTDIYNLNKGAVGIGVINPMAKLHIGGNGIFDGNLEVEGSAIVQNAIARGGQNLSNSPISALEFQNNNGSSTYTAAIIRSFTEPDANLGGDLRFATSTGVGPLVFNLVLSHFGNVGIGVIDPMTRLHVSGGDVLIDRGAAISDLTRSLTIGGARNTAGNAFAEIDFQNMDSNNGNTDYTGARISSENVGSTDDGNLRFYTSSNSSLTQRMTIDHNGNVGIGTTSPNRKLHISKGNSGAVAHSASVAAFEDDASAYLSIITGSSNERGILFGEPSNNAAGGIIYNNPSNPDGLQFRTNGNLTRMTIDDNGNVGIGDLTPDAKLDVVGDIIASGNVTASCGVLMCSDSRYKTIQQPLHNVLSRINAFNGVYYNWKTDAFPDKQFPDGPQLGVIAQDVQEVFPELVMEDKDGYLSVDYARLSVVLLEGVKEQQEVIQGLEAQLASLHDRMAALEEGRQGKTSP